MMDDDDGEATQKERLVAALASWDKSDITTRKLWTQVRAILLEIYPSTIAFQTTIKTISRINKKGELVVKEVKCKQYIESLIVDIRRRAMADTTVLDTVIPRAHCKNNPDDVATKAIFDAQKAFREAANKTAGRLVDKLLFALAEIEGGGMVDETAGTAADAPVVGPGGDALGADDEAEGGRKEEEEKEQDTANPSTDPLASHSSESAAPAVDPCGDQTSSAAAATSSSSSSPPPLTEPNGVEEEAAAGAAEKSSSSGGGGDVLGVGSGLTPCGGCEAIKERLEAKLPVWVEFVDNEIRTWYRGRLVFFVKVGFLVPGVLRCLTYCLAM
jgi:hypothetical protein